jgi:hypothetical protein
MVVLNVYHDLDNDVHAHVHVHLIVQVVDNNHSYNYHVVVYMMDTLAFHDENRLVVAMLLLLRMVTET